MSRGKKWDPSCDDVLRERYADTENAVLARESGYGLRTIERHAAKLGLKKSAALMEKTRDRATREAARWYEYMRVTGQKVKKKGVGGRPFEKGHRFEGEVEAKRVTAIRNRAWDERRRLMHGITRRTKWRMVDDYEKKL